MKSNERGFFPSVQIDYEVKHVWRVQDTKLSGYNETLFIVLAQKWRKLPMTFYSECKRELLFEIQNPIFLEATRQILLY